MSDGNDRATPHPRHDDYQRHESEGLQMAASRYNRREYVSAGRQKSK
jgi:hypothetical protein